MIFGGDPWVKKALEVSGSVSFPGSTSMMELGWILHTRMVDMVTQLILDSLEDYSAAFGRLTPNSLVEYSTALGWLVPNSPVDYLTAFCVLVQTLQRTALALGRLIPNSLVDYSTFSIQI